MPDWRDYFKGKKVTIMGLGLLGRGLGDAIFLAELGADLIITDLKNEKDLVPSLEKLKKFKNIKYVLGRHELADFRDRDFILKAAGVPSDSLHISEARKNKIPIEMDASLFAKLMPRGVTIVGVTGTRGKSTTTALIYEILKKSGRCVYKGGNLVSEATLPLLRKIKTGDIVVLELDSWQLQGFHDAKISPNVAVWTNFLDDHLVYYKGDRKAYFKDKSAIFKYQKRGDKLIVGEQVSRLISSRSFIVARPVHILKGWKIRLLGEHNRENIACAVGAARAMKVSDFDIKNAVENFKGLQNRLEYLRACKGIKIYNDNNATTPDATVAAIRAINKYSSAIVLIMGGTDKGLDMSKLIAEIPKYCKAIVLLEGTGTNKIRDAIYGLATKDNIKVEEGRTFNECIKIAFRLAKKGDIILFSPAFSSFGKWFKNEYDRGEQFVKIVKNLK